MTKEDAAVFLWWCSVFLIIAGIASNNPITTLTAIAAWLGASALLQAEM